MPALALEPNGRREREREKDAGRSEFFELDVLCFQSENERRKARSSPPHSRTRRRWRRKKKSNKDARSRKGRDACEEKMRQRSAHLRCRLLE